MALQIRRGTNAERLTITPLQGELIYTTDTKTVYIGDGITLGGIPVTTDVDSENIQDIVAPMFVGGSHTGISFTYNDGNGTIDAAVTGGGGGGSGSVTSVSVTSANGFTGSVLNSTTTPAITIGTSVTGLLKGNGESIAVATSGTDYQAPISLTTSGSSGAATFVGNVLNIPQYAGGGSSTLDSLSDVTITGTPAVDQIIKYNGTQWVNGSVSIDSLGDVILNGTPSANQVLKYDGVNWVNGTFALDSLSDVDIVGTPATGEYLQYDALAGTWVRGVTQLVKDLNPTLGGDLNLDGHDIQGFGSIRITRETDLNTSGIAVTLANDLSTTPSYISLAKTRGTIAAKDPLIDGDSVGSVAFNGWDGSNYKGVAAIETRINGTVSEGSTPGRMIFYTGNTAGALTAAMEIDAEQSLAVFTRLIVSSETLNDDQIRLFHSSNDTGDTANISMRRSRGTISSKLSVAAGDPIYDINFQGFDGTDDVTGAQIQAKVLPTGTVSTGIVPMQMIFRTRNQSGTLTGKLTINQGNVFFSVMPRLPSFANEAAAVASATSIFNGSLYYDTALGKVRAWVGGDPSTGAGGSFVDLN